MLTLVKRLAPCHGKAQGVKTKARIERIGKCGDLQCDEAHQPGAIAHGLRCFDCQPPHGPIGTKEDDLKPPPARAASLQQAHHIARQPCEICQQPLHSGDGRGKMLVCHDLRWWPKRRDADILAPQNPPQDVHQSRPEACRQHGRRAVGKIAQRSEPRPRQGQRDMSFLLKGCHRQRPRRLLLCGGWQAFGG